MTPEQLLREGLAVYGLPADAAAIEGLEEFSRRLLERNQVMNLTAITDPCDVAALHLLDCAYLLTAADFQGKSVVDVGTGAGFPGMPLRILEPNFDLTLLDSRGKRVDFLRGPPMPWDCGGCAASTHGRRSSPESTGSSSTSPRHGRWPS